MNAVGEFYKVFLPGESPWAECVAVHPDGTWEGRIDNTLIGSMSEADRLKVGKAMFDGATTPLPSLHGFKRNDVVRFKRSDDEFKVWVPAEQPAGNA